jgi:hypothetical protein
MQYYVMIYVLNCNPFSPSFSVIRDKLGPVDLLSVAVLLYHTWPGQYIKQNVRDVKSFRF